MRGFNLSEAPGLDKPLILCSNLTDIRYPTLLLWARNLSYLRLKNMNLQIIFMLWFTASSNVRHYVKENIIAPKRLRRDSLGEKSVDFLDSIMDYIDGKANDQKDAILTSQSALYALEDILGGHSAVANIILRILFDLALETNDDAKKEVKNEIDQIPRGGMISVEEKPNLPWVVASMHETIRMTCSPIVPHQATQDSSIGGT